MELFSEAEYDRAAEKAFNLFTKTGKWMDSAKIIAIESGIKYDDIEAMMQNISEECECNSYDSDNLATYSD